MRLLTIASLAGLAAVSFAGKSVDSASAEVEKSSRGATAEGSSFDGKSKNKNAYKKLSGDRHVFVSNGQTDGKRGSKEVDGAAGFDEKGVGKLAAAGDGFPGSQGSIADQGKGSGAAKINSGRNDFNALQSPNNFRDGAENKMFVAGQGKKLRGTAKEDEDCRKTGSTNCRATITEAGGDSARIVPKKVSNSAIDDKEGLFELPSKRSQGPLFYKTQCVRKGSDPCATTKSEIVDKNNNKVMNCEADEGRSGRTCCKRSRGSRKCDVEALTDKDGRTSVKMNGVLVQDSSCDVRKRSSDGKYFCAAGRGVFKANTDKLEATSSGRCYQRGKGEREIEVSNEEYVRESRSKTKFKFPECGFLKGDLTFKGAWKPNELKNIMANLGLQVHASVSPAGKLVCHDEGTCPSGAFSESCFYCNFCDPGRLKATVAEDVDLPCSEDGRLGRRVPFKAKVCAPTDEDTLVCPKMDSSVLSGYWQKKGDMDTRLEVYWRDNSRGRASYRTDFDRMRKATGILGFGQKLLLKEHEIKANAAGLRGNVAGPDGDPFVEAVFDSYWAKAQSKGTLVGCSTFYGDYGAGKGASDLLEVYKLSKSAGNPRDLIFGQKSSGKKCTRRARRKFRI